MKASEIIKPVDKIDFLWDDLLDNLTVSLQIPSVKRAPVAGMPFGLEVDRALRHVLECADRLGFKTCYGDGYYGYAEIGEGKEIIGVLCHVDVVPEGDVSAWKHSPFGGDQAEGFLWARGALDDKGPLFAALYAMKRLSEEQIHLGKRIRLIIGADEESGWECIKAYKAHEETPTCGFSPDAEFPVVHGEKGLMHIQLSGPQAIDGTVIVGGTAANAVPELCIYEGPRVEEIVHIMDDEGIAFKKEGSRISALGKAAHASVNWLGVNAISRMCKAAQTKDTPLLRFVADKIGEDPYGREIFGIFEDEASGSITINPGIIKHDIECSELVLDIRCPVTKSSDEVIMRLREAAAAYGLETSIMSRQEPLYVPLETLVVQKLTDAYEEVIGEVAPPITMGGGTYAKAFNRFVAFGPLFPGEEDTAHCTDERIALETLRKSMEIYYRALEKLVLNN